ncbi:MAG TPA: hypothetical protein VGS16_16150 [Candidatus Dormibacteraeota bacterium]|nr:hypothetical protein [Candidatus Dormibacteraeota bacterium]
MTAAEATSYQRLREHLAYLGMSAAAEHLSEHLDKALKHKLSPTHVLENLLDDGDDPPHPSLVLVGPPAPSGSLARHRPPSR